jgi:nucleotide-binding universal stress UspA family protein
MGDAAAQLYNDADRQTQQLLQGAEAYLQATGTALHRKGAWRTRVMLGLAGPEILEDARSESVDLVVLASHGRHGLERLLYGSVARELLHHAEVPVLILAREEAEGAPQAERSAVGQATKK